MRSITRVSRRYSFCPNLIGPLSQSKYFTLQRSLRTFVTTADSARTGKSPIEQVRLEDGPTLCISKHAKRSPVVRRHLTFSTAFQRPRGVLDGNNDLRNTGAKDEALEKSVAGSESAQGLPSGLDKKIADRASDAIANFEKLLSEGRAEIEDVRAMLRARKAQVLELPQSEQRQAAATGRIGGRCLEWLWENRSDSLRKDIDRELATDLCWLLHVEGLASYIDRWIEVDVHEYASTGSTSYEDIKCAAVLLAAQVQSELDWSSDGSLNTALEFLRSRKEHFDTAGLGDVPLWVPSCVMIEKYLFTEQSLPVKDELFDWFAHWAKQSRSDPILRILPSLYHPSNPNAYAFLKATSLHYSKFINKDRSGKSGRSRALINSRLRAAYILQMRGDIGATSTLEAFVRDSNPSVWWNRDLVYKRCKSDPKLAHLRSEAEARRSDDNDVETAS
ncbi:hypothetical protein HII31_05636 [Pseudocercospora fuligena]|uniref:Uncharacterized protein n=1 Tax=Pseudocercospora fuligena TaxID=685502 RepID=A0A8H6VIP6_9PEZI|nr:hypothetical protein HII31_05636 [Pseudocercospora fuligena]